MRMRHIKPGRGPSFMGGVIGIFMIGFGILWTALAAQASIVFALFGVLWTGIAVVQTVYNFKNAKSKNRYSQYDIVDSNVEPDPLNERFSSESPSDYYNTVTGDNEFCPYCGNRVKENFEFCNKCGKKLP